MYKYQLIGLFLMAFLNHSCRDGSREAHKQNLTNLEILREKPEDIPVPEGMIWIPGGVFEQGAVDNDKMASRMEKPRHPVIIDGFFMSTTEVTNAQYKKFVNETGYVTVAEREIEWEELRKQLPPGTLKPPDSVLQPGSLVFKKNPDGVSNLFDFSQWWEWKTGANWKQPEGPGSTIEGKDDYPVVHIAFEDAVAFCEWSETTLPTEAQWEYAARGGIDDVIYFWGNNNERLCEMANTWEGEFPTENTLTDGYEGRAPVKSFLPNQYGLYDMAGNVWEYTRDWHHVDYYKSSLEKGIIRNPQGPSTFYNPQNPLVQQKVIKGGSFLCNASYCSSYRVSARMFTSLDSAQEHLGFRTILPPEMIRKQKNK